nr:retrovirus-related Pol polyprotein from transposon TNT 1-94 [Tanacetum cinerariifolium]
INNLWKERGIEIYLIVEGTLQQNGLAERMNMTLLNKVRCLLIQSGLLDSFWAEATMTASYLINRLDDVKPEIIISKDVVFYESLMYKDTLKGAGVADSRKEVEFEVKLQGSRVEPTMDPHTGKIQGMKIKGLILVHDRAKRTTTIPTRDEFFKEEPYLGAGRSTTWSEAGSRVEDDMVAYEFAIAEEEDTHEPITFQEAINFFEKDEYKARLVARGFTHRAGINYNEVFSPVVRHTSIKVILLLAACENYDLEQIDVKTAFLHGNLEEAIYMRQTLGFEEGTGNKVSQSRYVQKIMNNYRVDNGKSVPVPLGAHFKVSLKDYPSSDWDVERMSKVPYANAVGSLMYLMEVVKWILKYLKGIADVDLVYGRDQGKHVDVDGFVNADYAKDPDKGRSVTGYVFMVYGCVVSWKATPQHVVALSTTEAEYMALTKAVKESIWLKGLLIELGVNLRLVVVNCDKQSAIHLSRNATFHERTKHINVRYYFIKEIVESKEIEVAKISTKDNAADAFTKVVPGSKFKYCMKILGVGAN